MGKIFDKIKYLIIEKTGIRDSINHNFARMRVDSYNYLCIKKVLTVHDVIILIKSVLNNNKKKYYYNIFWEIGLYKDKPSTEHF